MQTGNRRRRNRVLKSRRTEVEEFIERDSKLEIARLNDTLAEFVRVVDEHGRRLARIEAALPGFNRTVAEPSLHSGMRLPSKPAAGRPPWIVKREAARYLRVSLRQVERLAADGVIRKIVLPRQPHESSAKVIYAREDVEAHHKRRAGLDLPWLT
jgi:hypothetical protein